MLNHMRKCGKWLKSYTLYIPCQFNSPFLIFVWITFSYLYMCRVYIDWLVGTEKNIFYIHTRWHCVYVCVWRNTNTYVPYYISFQIHNTSVLQFFRSFVHRNPAVRIPSVPFIRHRWCCRITFKSESDYILNLRGISSKFSNRSCLFLFNLTLKLQNAFSE